MVYSWKVWELNANRGEVMERDTEKRLDHLEQEVIRLKAELSELKRANVVQMNVSPQPQTVKQAPVQPVKEKPLTKVFFPEQAEQAKKQTAVSSSEQLPERQTTNQQSAILLDKPKKSLEETFLNLLPKIFMVILVLGVLWGLKLASEYGYFSNTLKIVVGYLLAILLGVAAYVLEGRRGKTDSVIISLYGGAFMVGILTTAAGAILYDVLSLLLALFLALVFIAYGVTISYFKQNEVLTTFVAFTSLLLPYLLEYMDFDYKLIAIYVVLLFAVIQLVIVKFKQQWALYVATLFSISPLVTFMNFNDLDNAIISFSIIAIVAIFYYAWWNACRPNEALRQLHLSLLFGYSAYVLFAFSIMWDINETPVYIALTLVVIQGAFAYYAHAKEKRDVFDVMGSVLILSVLHVILVLNIASETRLLLMLITSFVGLMLALKLRVSLMKAVHSVLFIIIAVLAYIIYDVKPFIGIENLVLLLVPIMLICAYVYAQRPKETLNWLEVQIQAVRFMDIVPVITFCFLWAYIYQFDYSYPVFSTTEYDFSYGVLRDILLAFLFVASFIISKKWVGTILPTVAFILFIVKSIMVNMDPWLYSREFAEVGLVRLVYLFFTIAILVDLWKKGLIYRNFQSWIDEYIQPIIIASIVWILFLLFGTTEFLHVFDVLNRSIAVMMNTFGVFISAIIALRIGSKFSYKNVNIFGFLLLVFGFIKMIFFDLSTLDLLIRSILFIIIGGVGLIVSNRFMKK
jgi:hypothetical protein